MSSDLIVPMALIIPTLNNLSACSSPGVSWVRATQSGYSPLTFGEILSGCYTLEVDYISWDYAAVVLAASSSYNVFEDLTEQLAIGASSTVLTALVCTALGISASGITITSLIVGAVVGVGWNILSKLDRSNMYTVFQNMTKSKMMKVQFMWASNMVNKIYSVYSPTYYITTSGSYIYQNIANPFPVMYGSWRTGTIGYLYDF